MSSNILKADNGVSSGTTGLVYTAGNDGTLQLATTTSGGTATTAITIDNSQNVGVGVTPSAWGSSNKAIDIGAYSSFAYRASNGLTVISNNLYLNSSDQFIYKTTNPGALYQIGGIGEHYWYTASSGTAGTQVTTLPRLMTLSNNVNGTLGVGIAPNTGWSTSANGFSAIQVGNGMSLWAGAGSTSPGSYVSNNVYYDGANRRYLVTGYATEIDMGGGSINTYTVASGSAGGVITLSTGPYVGNGGTTWTSGSDLRLKNVTGEIQNGLSKVLTLRAAEFTWKSDATNKPQVGLIAQEVQQVLPEAVNSNAYIHNDETEYLGVNYTEVIPLLVAAIKELSAEVTALKAKVA